MGMIIHDGGIKLNSIDDFRSLEDPTPMGKMHYPIRHDYFLDLIERGLTPKGWTIKWSEFALHLDKDRGYDNAFGLWGLESDNTDETRILGCRNSGTQHFSAQLGAGQHVTVCDNLLFSAAVMVGRKHTKNIIADLPRLVRKTMGRISDEFVNQERRTEVYKETKIERTDANHIMMETVRAKAIPPSQLLHWVNEWEKPTHEEFADRTAWSLQNAFTEVAKRWPFNTMQDRTCGLTGVMDTVVEVDLIKTDLTEGMEDVEVIADQL